MAKTNNNNSSNFDCNADAVIGASKTVPFLTQKYMTNNFIAVFAIALALAFDFVNGFHDTANAVATVIETGALPKRIAILLSGSLNFVGAISVGTMVAMTITKILPPSIVNLRVVIALLLGALIWNLLTWQMKLPVSSSHCLIGAICGAGFASAGREAVAWSQLGPVLLALLISPAIGFWVAALVTWLAGVSTKSANSSILRVTQIASSCFVSFAHGSNDGQKTMGVITLILASQFAEYGYTTHRIPIWVQFGAALAIGLGTTIGGERIIQTVGKGISRVPLNFVHGFGAESATAIVILAASCFGFPVSTTHTLSSAIAGATLPLHGIDNINFRTTRKILLAWILTLPSSGLLAWSAFHLLTLMRLS